MWPLVGCWVVLALSAAAAAAAAATTIRPCVYYCRCTACMRAACQCVFMCYQTNGHVIFYASSLNTCTCTFIPYIHTCGQNSTLFSGSGQEKIGSFVIAHAMARTCSFVQAIYQQADDIRAQLNAKFSMPTTAQQHELTSYAVRVDTVVRTINKLWR